MRVDTIRGVQFRALDLKRAAGPKIGVALLWMYALHPHKTVQAVSGTHYGYLGITAYVPSYFLRSNAASNARPLGLKSLCLTKAAASVAPCSRSMPLSSHSTESGPL